MPNALTKPPEAASIYHRNWILLIALFSGGLQIKKFEEHKTTSRRSL